MFLKRLIYKFKRLFFRSQFQFDYFSDFLFYFLNTVLFKRNLSHSYLVELTRKIKIIDDSMGFLKPSDIDLCVLSHFLNEHTNSSRMFNQYRSLFHDIFVEMMDNGLVNVNVAKLKKPKKYKRSRIRLTVQQYLEIYKAAPNWLKVAMSLSLQTTHGRYEVVNMKYSHVVNGHLRIHRKKTKSHPASYVEIPVSTELTKTISLSRDGLLSPYIVHYKPVKITQARRAYNHPTQITSDQLTRKFKAVRDSLSIFDSVPMKTRPTFHEIRSLSIWIGEQLGHDMQSRAAHSSREMTERYIEGHNVRWNRVDDVQINLKNWSE